jgi:CMP-N,N'-diacetyllegionaminic acid synthase
MIDGNTILAIIPARGGSKRLPRKNILPLGNKPLIEWSIEAAQKSKYIDCIIVSSEDSEILDIARKCGVVALNRPSELASDIATSYSVIEHVLESSSRDYDFVILLQPTSPLRNETHVDQAIENVQSKNADAVISVVEMEHSPLWSNTLPADDNMDNFISESAINMRSQDLPKYFRLNGALYLCRVECLLREKRLLLKNNTYAYKMNPEYSVDIDTKLDFKLAEFLLTQEL